MTTRSSKWLGSMLCLLALTGACDRSAPEVETRTLTATEQNPAIDLTLSQVRWVLDATAGPIDLAAVGVRIGAGTTTLRKWLSGTAASAREILSGSILEVAPVSSNLASDGVGTTPSVHTNLAKRCEIVCPDNDDCYEVCVIDCIYRDGAWHCPLD